MGLVSSVPSSSWPSETSEPGDLRAFSIVPTNSPPQRGARPGGQGFRQAGRQRDRRMLRKGNKVLKRVFYQSAFSLACVVVHPPPEPSSTSARGL